MPHARAEMYKRREDVQLWRGRWGCASGEKASPPITPAERKSPPLERKEPPLASQHLVNIRGPSACGVVEGRR